MRQLTAFVLISFCSFLFLWEETASAGGPIFFVIPPTPQCGSTFFVNVGDTLDFRVELSSTSADDLEVSGLPAGATMTPTLPTHCSGGCFSDFSWTPTSAQIGTHVVTFKVTDFLGNTPECSLTIEVEGAALPVPTFTGLGGSIFALVLIGVGVYLVGRRQRLA